MSHEWIAPFDTMEINMIQNLWKGGWIRRLTRIIEAMLDARDRPEMAN